jgi:hypothetical protein
MARKRGNYPGYKVSAIRLIDALNKNVAHDISDLRQLTKDELKRLGKSPGARAYTTQKPGVKALNPAKVLSRRQVLKMARGASPERYAAITRAKNADRPSPTATATDLARAYQAKLEEGRKMGIREIQRSEEFKRLKKDARDHRVSKDKAVNDRRAHRRLAALRQLGLISEDDYHEWDSMYE